MASGYALTSEAHIFLGDPQHMRSAESQGMLELRSFGGAHHDEIGLSSSIPCVPSTTNYDFQKKKFFFKREAVADGTKGPSSQSLIIRSGLLE